MRLTVYTDYALRLLMYLAVKDGGLATIAEVAKSYGISKNHLMKVAHQLGQAGYVGTVRGRVGYAMNNVLIFATGGLAYGTVRAQIGGFTESRTSTGWTIGAGAEVGLTQHWSVKAEYLYVDLSDNRFAITGLPHAYAGSVFRLGVNYRF